MQAISKSSKPNNSLIKNKMQTNIVIEKRWRIYFHSIFGNRNYISFSKEVDPEKLGKNEGTLSSFIKVWKNLLYRKICKGTESFIFSITTRGYESWEINGADSKKIEVFAL